MSEHEQEHDELQGVEDFDAFWQERENKDKRNRQTRVRGVVVELPSALPLQFELEAKRLQRSKKKADIQKLLGILFGHDKLDELVKAGLDYDQLAVLLAWAPQVIAGENVTLAEVAAELDAEQERDADPS